MRIALAHDSLTQMGGAERLVSAMHEMFPHAPVYTLVIDRRLKNHYQGWSIRVSWLQKIYNFFPRFQLLFPLIPLAVQSLDFSGYDVVLSSSSSFIKNITVPKSCLHINYCNTPTRFLWQDENYVRQEVFWPFWPLARLAVKLLKRWDYAGAQRVNVFISNSQEVQKRVKAYYKRDSEVVYPFVDLDFWRPVGEKKDYFLLAGRLQAHKNNELIVKIFNDLGLPLHVAGIGRQEAYLRSIAKPNISFLGYVSDERLREEYSGAKAFIYPQLEDFGLMPLEAAACGTPTLAYGKGGVLETVVSGVTGEFFANYDQKEIKKIILSWPLRQYKIQDLRAQAEKFSKEKFTSQLKELVLSAYENCH